MARRRKTILELDLVAVARWQKAVSWCLIGYLPLLVALVVLSVNQYDALFGLLSLLTFVVGIVAVVFVCFLQRSIDTSIAGIVLYAIVGLVPGLLTFLVMVSSMSQASTVLRLAGAKMGFFGLAASERMKITPGHCRGCGYDRSGIALLQECPECSRVPQVV